MNSSLSRASAQLRKSQRGIGLLEIFIGLTIALFLLAGLLTVFAGTSQNFTAQNKLSQLQDDQRMAMGLLSTVIQEAGYFPSPQTLTITDALPSSATFVQSAAVAGTSTSAGPDTIAVRYVASPAGTSTSDFLMDCNGGSNSSPSGTVTFINTFALSGTDLTCAVNSNAARKLVGGISNLVVLYGIDPDGNSSVNQYLPAASMTAALWPAVISVKVTLTFVNPLFGQPGQLSTIPFTRVISLMSKS